MISGEQWMEKTQAGLSEIYKLEGKITADTANAGKDITVQITSPSQKVNVNPGSDNSYQMDNQDTYPQRYMGSYLLHLHHDGSS